VVAGIGMVAALGTDVATNCAASRAGITRSSTLEHYKARSAVDGLDEPINGHQASLFTRGFEGDARLVRLAQGALTDLLVQSPGLDWTRRPTQFYMSLPDARRIRTGFDLIAEDDVRREHAEEEAARQQVERQAGAPAADVLHAARAARTLERAAALARWPSAVSRPRVSFAGHTGGIDAIRVALADLAAGTTELAVILGVESFLDEDTLAWLHLCGRLKCDGMPAGLQPGEAGVAIALASRDPRPPAGRPLPAVATVSVAREARTLIAGASATGEALAAVIGECWDGRDRRTPWIISDHNGEVYRASDWGHAVVRLRAQFEAFDDPAVWIPAVSFGDTGAASALLGVCIAIRAWDRNHAPATTAIVAATADDDSRAALALEAPAGIHG
jgi:hypothetical protein